MGHHCRFTRFLILMKNRILPHYGIILDKLKKDKIVELSAVLIPVPERGYVAFNPETGTATQGETVGENWFSICTIVLVIAF